MILSKLLKEATILASEIATDELNYDNLITNVYGLFLGIDDIIYSNNNF